MGMSRCYFIICPNVLIYVCFHVKASNIVSNFKHYIDDNDHHSHIFYQVKVIVVDIRNSVELRTLPGHE